MSLDTIDTTNTDDMIAANGHIGAVQITGIVNEMQTAYLDYAMSVIVSRALPDVRDGLKPVHRRILYAMYHDLGLIHTKPYKKSARIVGEVLGKYHPHGETAVYDALVRMAQEFSLRYPLIDGQGNFGSIDGDNAAAMRYTEARLDEISDLILADLEKETVDWHDNFDNSLREPDILPATLPNLLINGSSGIAVGMATNIPPHNLSEVVDALAFMIDRYAQLEEITTEQLLQFIQGPDFPTGGILYRFRQDVKDDENTDVIAQGYSVGKASLVMQAKAHFEEMSRGRSRIVVTELPYQTNKAALLERIASLVRDGKLEGITDLRDESDRTGMRVVIELTRNVEPKDVLADLFKYTPLQQTFGMQLLALADGEPRTLSLKRMLHLFIQHRQEIVRRRSEFDLARARERAHIVEGLLRALDILDEVINAIRRSQSADTARANLMRHFGFSEVQAQAILEMQLRRLAALERKKLQDEYKELQKQIKYLESLLADPAKILTVIKDELLAIKEKFGDARRTQIVDRTKGTLTTTDLLPDQDIWVSVSADGELRRQDIVKLSTTTLRQIGKGSEVALLTANTRDYLYLFSKDGRCARVAIHELPQDGTSKHLAELCNFTRRDTITAALAIPREMPEEAQGYLFLTTEQGLVKRVALADFLAIPNGEVTIMNVDEKDRLGWARRTRGNQEVILVSANGQAIRFSEEDVRAMGLPAGGVGGMKLGKGDVVVHADVVEPAGSLATVTTEGYMKQTPLAEYSSQGRYGGGIVTHKLSARTGRVVDALVLDGGTADAMAIIVADRGNPQPLPAAEIPQMGRSVQGKQVITLDSGRAVAALKTARSALPAASPTTSDDRSAVEPPKPAKTDQAGKRSVESRTNSAREARSTSSPTLRRRGKGDAHSVAPRSSTTTAETPSRLSAQSKEISPPAAPPSEMKKLGTGDKDNEEGRAKARKSAQLGLGFDTPAAARAKTEQSPNSEAAIRAVKARGAGKVATVASVPKNQVKKRKQ